MEESCYICRVGIQSTEHRQFYMDVYYPCLVGICPETFSNIEFIQVSSQGQEIPNGWPLGLENVSMRLQAAESSRAATALAAEPSSLHGPSSSFSSFSSSNLDTESTTSFFQDHSSMTLGRLIGIKPGDRRSLYFPNTTVQFQRDKIIYEQVLDSAGSGNHETETSGGICVPLLHNMIMKRSRSKSSARL